jgi:adenylate cyclase
VNLASRLEGLTRVYTCDILVGETTMDRLGDAFWAREVDRVRVKGKDIPARLYELIAPRDQPCPVDLAAWERALEAYRHARWDEAREALRGIVTARGQDGPSAALLARIDRLEREGVDPATWDGVVAMETK